MNVFSRIKSSVVALFGLAAILRGRVTPELDAPPTPKPRHMVRFRQSIGRIFGPAFDVPREGHHVSRQTARHYLRARFFASVSQGNPLMSRRERRRFARLFACLEYRRMMTDQTNAIPDEAERIYSRMTAEELAA